MGLRSPFPPTSVMKEFQSNYVEETSMLDDSSVLNYILLVPNEGNADGATIAHIPSRSLPNGLIMTYQDINNSILMSM
jgi:hypothetical protein